MEAGLSAIDQIASISINATKEIFSYMFEVIIFIMAFYFSLFESKRDRYWFFVYTPPFVRETWKSYFKRAIEIFTTFLYVEIRLISLTFILLALGFWLLDFTYPLQKAFFIALADCLPFFGIGLVLIPLAIYFYLVEEIILCIAVIVLYIFIQTTRQLYRIIFMGVRVPCANSPYIFHQRCLCFTIWFLWYFVKPIYIAFPSKIKTKSYLCKIIIWLFFIFLRNHIKITGLNKLRVNDVNIISPIISDKKPGMINNTAPTNIIKASINATTWWLSLLYRFLDSL